MDSWPTYRLFRGWALLDLLKAVDRCPRGEVWRHRKVTLPPNMSRKGTWGPHLLFALSQMLPKVGAPALPGVRMEGPQVAVGRGRL